MQHQSTRRHILHAIHGIILMGLFELFGMGAAQAQPADARAPRLAAADRFFEPDALALLKAALAGDEAGVRRLVAAGVNPNSQGPKSASKATPQLTLLNYATAEKNERALALLIAVGANPLFEPREDDGNAFLFAVVRHDAKMLDALYRLWPMSRIPAKVQSQDAFSALGFKCKQCLDVMFLHGLPPGVQDSIGYNLFMAAVSGEALDTAEWLLTEKHVPLNSESSGGINPPNSVQLYLSRYRPDTPTYQQLLRMKQYMEKQGVVFPVETSAEIRTRKGIK